MNSGKPRVVFFGNEQLATGTSTEFPHMRMLLEAGYDVAALVTKPQLQDRSLLQQSNKLHEFASQKDIPVLTPTKLADILHELRNLHADVGVLAAYGKIIPESIIELFPRGIVNIHPSLLPLHRGPTPIESVILNGESRTGVSLMSLVKAMDAGPIYAQSVMQLSGHESKQELCDSLSDISVGMLRELLPGILNGEIIAAPQDDQEATYDNLIAKSDGIIDWGKPAQQLEREIRAYAAWPKSLASIGNVQAILLDATKEKWKATTPGTIHATADSLSVECGEDRLAISRLQPLGKKPMGVSDFLRGYKDRI